ncbi:WD repeat-containing protein [Reticulomyxa filosa]|uniref:WD repeat-containing protein n=1 Tax=Reticulomyxa filosa TaxID=46433 RepID=X6P850_RETFI|nr:WD repeat-containing protein [Reticulomyxa filosa]|eukprot:ETO34715.1 WD repeat-containing protein [Reticulomyxa filosa]
MKFQGLYFIFCVNFSSNGKYVISYSMEKITRLWDIGIGKQIQTFEDHSNYVRSVQYSSDDQTIGLCDLQSGHSNIVSYATFFPDNKYIASCSYDKTIRIWNVESGVRLKILKGHSYIVAYVTYFPDGQSIVSCSKDKTIRLWNVKNGKRNTKI